MTPLSAAVCPPPSAGMRRIPSGRWVWILAAALLTVRLALIAAYPALADRVPDWRWDNNDGYDTLAIHWLETGVYGLEPGLPTALRLPLYPALIAAVYRLAGGPVPAGVMLVQALLSVGTGLLLYDMTVRLFGRRAGLAAALVFLVHPQVNNFVFRCATETLFLFLVTALCHQAAAFLRTRRPRHLLLAALAMGLSLLTRQTLAPLAGAAVLLLPGASVFAPRRERKRRLAWALAAIAAGMAVLAPWLLRNRRQAGEWVLQTWTGQPMCQGLYVSRHLEEFFARRRTLTELDQAALFEIGLLERRLRRRWPDDLPPVAREAAADRFFRRRALDLMARAPAGQVRRTLRNLAWAPVLQMTWRGTFPLMILNWPILLLGAWGLAHALRMPRTVRIEILPALAVFAYLYASHALTWPQARYLLPGLVPFLAFTGLGIDRLFRRSPPPSGPVSARASALPDPAYSGKSAP